MDLQQLIDSAPEGGTVTVPKGTHEAQLRIGRSITLKGEGPTRSILDAKGLAACVAIDGAKTKVTLIGLTLRNGAGPEGGCIAFRLGEALVVEDCVLEGGSAKMYGGGGARLAGRTARLVRTRIHKCTAQQGGGLLADEECEVALHGCVIAGNTATHGAALRIKEGAKVTLVHCTLADNQAIGKNALADEILINGTMTRTPELKLINSIVAPKTPTTAPIAALGSHPGKVAVAHSLFPAAAKAHVPEGPGLLFAPPEFMPQGQHRHALSPTSPAAGSGDPKATPEGLVDPRGNALLKGDRTDIGAYSA